MFDSEPLSELVSTSGKVIPDVLVVGDSIDGIILDGGWADPAAPSSWAEYLLREDTGELWEFTGGHTDEKKKIPGKWRLND